MITARVRHRVEQLTPIIPSDPLADRLFYVSALLMVLIVILTLARICENLEVKEEKPCTKRRNYKRRVNRIRKIKPVDVVVLLKDDLKERKDEENAYEDEKEKELNEEDDDKKKPKPKQKGKKIKENNEIVREEEEDDNSNEWFEVKREKIFKKKDEKPKVASADKNVRRESRKTKNVRNNRNKSAKSSKKTDTSHKNNALKDMNQSKNRGKLLSRGPKPAPKDKAPLKTKKDQVTQPCNYEKKRKGKGKAAVKNIKQQETPPMVRSYAAVVKAGLY